MSINHWQPDRLQETSRLAREGSNVTLASYETMEKFGIGAIQTMYNIRRRVKRRQAEAEKKNADV